jgi:hypothetical protein
MTPDPITSADRLRDLLAKTTQEEWCVVEYNDGKSLVIHSDDENRVCFMATPGAYGNPERIEANAEFIAAAHNELPALLSDHDRLIEKNRRMQEALAAIRCKIAEQSPESIACVQGMEEIDDLAQTALTEDGNG